MERPRPTGGWFAPPVTVHYEAETATPVVVRDARAGRVEKREVRGISVRVEPGETDGVDVFVAGERDDTRLVEVAKAVVRRIEYDAAIDAYYRAASTGRDTPPDLRRYLRNLERTLGNAAVEVAADGFPA